MMCGIYIYFIISVMAGFGAKGIQNDRFISTKTLRESRGVSFAMGGV